MAENMSTMVSEQVRSLPIIDVKTKEAFAKREC